MSIHKAIEARRKALGWSQKRLAEEVSRLEGRAKPLGYQVVQQWENGQAAPTRVRLPFVAEALGTSPEALMSGAVSDAAVTNPLAKACERAAHLPLEQRAFLAGRLIQMVIQCETGALPEDPPPLPERAMEVARMMAKLSADQLELAHSQVTGYLGQLGLQKDPRSVFSEVPDLVPASPDASAEPKKARPRSR